MKAILVIDIPITDYANREISMPKIEYRLFNKCNINGEDIYVDMGIHGCELIKPMPEKMDTSGNYETDFALNYYLSLKRNNVENAYEVGWNDCIDEILEGEEE